MKSRTPRQSKPKLLKNFTAWALLDYNVKHPHAIYGSLIQAELHAARCPGIKIQKVRCESVGKAKVTPW